jgi:hypothetical protein
MQRNFEFSDISNPLIRRGRTVESQKPKQISLLSKKIQINRESGLAMPILVETPMEVDLELVSAIIVFLLNLGKPRFD